MADIMPWQNISGMENNMASKRNDVPKHIAVIMDGNGRWAKKRLLPRTAGHIQGSKNVEGICRAAYELGVEYLTVYAFSTENWSRPKDEVGTIMGILSEYLESCIEKSTANNMRVKIIGDRSALTPSMQEKIEELERVSSVNTGLTFIVALNYGGRDEILRAAKKMAKEYKEGKADVEGMKEADFENYLDTAGIPSPDLMIRTSGELRLSNYMLWQLAYAEFYFTDCLWPDFDSNELKKAIDYYTGRERRFGKV